MATFVSQYVTNSIASPLVSNPGGHLISLVMPESTFTPGSPAWADNDIIVVQCLPRFYEVVHYVFHVGGFDGSFVATGTISLNLGLYKAVNTTTGAMIPAASVVAGDVIDEDCFGAAINPATAGTITLGDAETGDATTIGYNELNAGLTTSSTPVLYKHPMWIAFTLAAAPTTPAGTLRMRATFLAARTGTA